MENLCSYYQAQIEKKHCWFVVAVLRSSEHVAFDRTLDKEQSIFEFFVPTHMVPVFLQIMHYLQKNGFIQYVHQLPNRLA
jgi:mannitol/fructose-specific phosphotransferase system IIA component (Ntr-type)